MKQYIIVMRDGQSEPWDLVEGTLAEAKAYMTSELQDEFTENGEADPAAQAVEALDDFYTFHGPYFASTATGYQFELGLGG